MQTEQSLVSPTRVSGSLREGQEKDLFFHSNELVGVSFDELREGDTLTFEVADSPKGPNAVRLAAPKRKLTKRPTPNRRTGRLCFGW